MRNDTQTQRLAQMLRDRITDQGLLDGEFFMTEADLADEYGVSRSMAREAAMQLRAVGLLESRKHKGLIVSRPDPIKLFSDSLPAAIQSNQDLLEVTRLRYVIEVGAIELAVTNATVEQIDRLEKHFDQLKEAVASADTEQQAKAALQFHALLLEMTGSQMVAKFQQVLSRYFELARASGVIKSADEQTIWEHHTLVGAFRDRDVERARSMVRMQFQKLINQVQAIT